MAAPWWREASPRAASVFFDQRPLPPHLVSPTWSPQKPSETSAFLDQRLRRRPVSGYPSRFEDPSVFGCWTPRASAFSPRVAQQTPRSRSSLWKDPVSTQVSPRLPSLGLIEVTPRGRTTRSSSVRGGVSPEKIEVHHPSYIISDANLVAAGVRTAQSTAFTTPWTVATSKPHGQPVGTYGCFL